MDGRRDSHAVQPVDVGGKIVAQLENLLHPFVAAVLAGRFFEFHLFTEPVARGGDARSEQRSPCDW